MIPSDTHPSWSTVPFLRQSPGSSSPTAIYRWVLLPRSPRSRSWITTRAFRHLLSLPLHSPSHHSLFLSTPRSSFAVYSGAPMYAPRVGTDGNTTPALLSSSRAALHSSRCPGARQEVSTWSMSSTTPHVMVCTSEGWFYVYSVSLDQGGEGTLLKQYSLLDGDGGNSSSNSRDEYE